jgi:hypothetical protein
MTPAMRKKISIAVKAANRRRAASRSPIRRAFSAVAARTSPRRSVTRRSGVGGSIGGIFKKDMLMRAGGVIAASMATSYVIKNYGAKLPGANTQYGRLIYYLGIPVAAGFLLRKKSPALAEGLILGGLVMTINSLITAATAPAPAATVANPPVSTVGRFAIAGAMPGRYGAYVRGGNPIAAAHVGGTNKAFQTSSWQ